MSLNVDRLLKSIDYEFSDTRHLKCALTHRSAGKNNNERLEYLGDSILGFVISNELYIRFDSADEGQLSRLRSSLVKGETLAKIARELALGDCLILGSGELKSGGFRRDSILADALEALIGAIYIDSSIDEATRFILRLFESQLIGLSLSTVLKDPKTLLQEYLQSIKEPLPEYSVLSIEGEGDNQVFYVTCSSPLIIGVVNGTGSSRRKAEQDAAKKMLTELNQ